MKRSKEVMRFPPHTRLMCPNCHRISSRHNVVKNSLHKQNHGYITYVVVHKCNSCGYTDDFGSGFIDSGNYSCEATEKLSEWKDEVKELEEEISKLKYNISKGELLWDSLWNTEEDVN